MQRIRRHVHGRQAVEQGNIANLVFVLVDEAWLGRVRFQAGQQGLRLLLVEAIDGEQ